MLFSKLDGSASEASYATDTPHNIYSNTVMVLIIISFTRSYARYFIMNIVVRVSESTARVKCLRRTKQFLKLVIVNIYTLKHRNTRWINDLL